MNSGYRGYAEEICSPRVLLTVTLSGRRGLNPKASCEFCLLLRRGARMMPPYPYLTLHAGA